MREEDEERKGDGNGNGCEEKKDSLSVGILCDLSWGERSPYVTGCPRNDEGMEYHPHAIFMVRISQGMSVPKNVMLPVGNAPVSRRDEENCFQRARSWQIIDFKSHYLEKLWISKFFRLQTKFRSDVDAA